MVGEKMMRYADKRVDALNKAGLEAAEDNL
jgi:hypothetical protein